MPQNKHKELKPEMVILFDLRPGNWSSSITQRWGSHRAGHAGTNRV